MKSTTEWDTWKKLTTNALRLVAKAYPTISATTSNEDLILTITNPSDSEENIDIKSFGIDGKVVNVYFNGSQLDLNNDINDEIANANVSLAAGNKVELRIQAAKSSTVTVNSILFDAGNQKDIVVNSDYNNIGNWSSFKVSAGDKGSDEKVVLTADKTHGTSSMTTTSVTSLNILSWSTVVSSISISSWATLPLTVQLNAGSTASVTASSSNTGAATVTVSGKTVSVYGTWAGTSIITITAWTMSKDINTTVTNP